MKNCVFIFSLIVFLVTGCKKNPLKQYAEHPDLPAYSEKGLNVGGCFIDDTTWLVSKPATFSRTKPLYIKSFPNGDSIVFYFNGITKGDNLQTEKSKTIFIVLKNIKIGSDTDLLKLKDKAFILDGVSNYGGFINLYEPKMAGKATGTFSLGNVTRIETSIYGDGSPDNPKRHPYIVPGRFEMIVTTDRKHSVTNGRFDMTVLQSPLQFTITW